MEMAQNALNGSMYSAQTTLSGPSNSASYESANNGSGEVGSDGGYQRMSQDMNVPVLQTFSSAQGSSVSRGDKRQDICNNRMQHKAPSLSSDNIYTGKASSLPRGPYYHSGGSLQKEPALHSAFPKKEIHSSASLDRATTHVINGNLQSKTRVEQSSLPPHPRSGRPLLGPGNSHSQPHNFTNEAAVNHNNKLPSQNPAQNRTRPEPAPRKVSEKAVDKQSLRNGESRPSLLRNGKIEQGALQTWLIDSVQRAQLSVQPAVQRWLSDVRLITETECMHVLQGKSIQSREPLNLPRHSPTPTVKETIDQLQQKAHQISADFNKLFKKLDKERYRHVRSDASRLEARIRAVLLEVRPDLPSYITEHERVTLEESSAVLAAVDRLQRASDSSPARDALLQQMRQLLQSLAQKFSGLIDLTLGFLVMTVVDAVEAAPTEPSSEEAVDTLIQLGLEGDHMCFIIAREGGVGALFQLIRTQPNDGSLSRCLRAVATVCCVPESVSELEKMGGVSCLADILLDPRSSERSRSEAAGVVAQITSPCLERQQLVSGFIEHMQDLICALTDLCDKASTPEMFLLGSAALANITFMDSLACDYLQQYHTATILIRSCFAFPQAGLFAMDQVATVLANMAVVDSCRQDIVRNRGLELLLTLLNQKPSHCRSAAELEACERVQQKAAIALTRLSREPAHASAVVRLGGLPRLIQLCRDVKERNNSDAVLVACLAALRKVSASSGAPSLASLDAEQLVEPKLLDSFLMCSNMEESFV